MPLDPAQRHQIEQDAITAAWEADRLAACDEAVSVPCGGDGILFDLVALGGIKRHVRPP